MPCNNNNPLLCNYDVPDNYVKHTNMTDSNKSGGKCTVLYYSSVNSASDLPNDTVLQKTQKAILTLELRSLSTVLSTSSKWTPESSEARKFCPRCSPETGEGAEQRPGRHTHGATHDKAHLHAVEAAGLGLPVGTHGHRHLRGKGQDSEGLVASRGVARGPRQGSAGLRTEARPQRASTTLLAVEDPARATQGTVGPHLTSFCAAIAQRSPRLTPKARRRALAVRWIASGARRSYFREHGLRTGKRRGWWALLQGTCCCEPLGGGRRWRLPLWPCEGPRCQAGDCACAVRSLSFSLPRFLEERAPLGSVLLRTALLRILPAGFHFSDAKLSRRLVSYFFSGWPLHSAPHFP